MSAPQPYKIDQSTGVLEQIGAIKAIAKKEGQFAKLVAIMKEAIRRLEMDPHGWGDPQYKAKTVDAVAYRGILWPVVFEYVVYDQIHGVVVKKIKLVDQFA